MRDAIAGGGTADTGDPEDAVSLRPTVPVRVPPLHEAVIPVRAETGPDADPSVRSLPLDNTWSMEGLLLYA